MRPALILLFFSPAPAAALPPFQVVAVPVADVRAASGSIAKSQDYDPLQETQLLYGEPVRVLEQSGDWLKIEAPEQAEYSHQSRWQGYPGWIHKSAVRDAPEILPPNCVVKKKIARLHAKPSEKSKSIPLSLGTRLIALDAVKNGWRQVRAVPKGAAWVRESDLRALTPAADPEKLRQAVLDAASELIGDLYFWGGRSAHIPGLGQQVTAVDCSGLTHLAYRVAGMEIPRDSLEQSMKARKIAREELRPGDLIFSASKDKPEKVSHVTIFVDSETLLEAPQTGLPVRKISFKEKYGAPLGEIVPGKPVGDRVLTFGTYFPARP